MTGDLTDPVFRELCKRSPMFFREHLELDGPNGIGPWKEFMADFQVKCFNACDPSLLYVSKVDTTQHVPYRRHYWQRGRGSSKTTDLASCVAWLLMFSNIPLDMIVVAEDQDQALFIRQQMGEIVGFNPELSNYIDIQNKKMVGRHNGATLRSISRDRNSSYGLTPHVTFADEWSHWTQPGFWTSIYSSYNKRADKGGVIFVSCNAGEGRDWKWTARENFRTSRNWFFSAPQGAAPWYSEESLKEQRLGMSPSEFDRLWRNIWQDSAGGYVTLDEADACTNPNLEKRSTAEQEGWVYVAAVDYAEKNDRTVGVVAHRYDDKIIVDRMDVIDPTAYGVSSVRLDYVEKWMRDVNASFGGHNGLVEFITDKWQLLSIIQRLRDEGFWIEEFEFASGIGNFEIGLILRQLILHGKVEWYENCGQITTPDGEPWLEEERDDLCTELAALEKKDISSGRWRFQHGPSGHDDRAFALGAAVRHIVVNSGGLEGWHIIPPDSAGHFNIREAAAC